MPRYLAAAPAAPTARFRVASPDATHEREADRAADRVLNAPQGRIASPQELRADAPADAALGRAAGSHGEPLDPDTRAFMEARLGADLGAVRVHTGPRAAQLNRALGARAFTQGRDVFFGEGYAPGRNAVTAHELAHVVQQSGGARGPAGPLSALSGAPAIQCSLTGSYAIPGRQSAFEIDLQTREGALASPAEKSGLDGYILFVPAAGDPNSNVIRFWQVNSTVDASGADVNAWSMPAEQSPRGALGEPGLRTAEDPLRGIQGGFKTDVRHRPDSTSPGVPRGSPLSQHYPLGAAPPGTTGFAGTTQQPASRGGGIGADPVDVRPGFKRSDDPADMRIASLYDFPGTRSPADIITWTFESAAMGEDTGIAYGVVHWGFTVDHGRVTNEHLRVEGGTSATFAEAQERHRDFYVHEPVTFYFAFDSDVLSPSEAAKIDAFLPYLARNPDVHLALEGYADQAGGPGEYNARLSLRRAEVVQAELIARGVAADRIDGIIIGHGASTAATADAGTGNLGGDPRGGADQSREANRWANRRVVVTFSHVAATP